MNIALETVSPESVFDSGFNPGWQPPITLRNLAEDDESLIVELIQLFQLDTAMRLQELGEALSFNDRTKMRAEAHGIKGSALQMGLEQIAAICRSIELSVEETPAALLHKSVNELEAALRDASSAMSQYRKTSVELSASDRTRK